MTIWFFVYSVELLILRALDIEKVWLKGEMKKSGGTMLREI